MIKLIRSVLAGLYFLISGKVSFGKTLYLEGTKARVAGLILLLSVGLAIVVLMAGSLYRSAGEVSDTQAFEQGVNTFANALVSNGLWIGLAYINFYVVSRNTKERGGCLTLGLAYAAYLELLFVYVSFRGFASSPSWLRNAILAISVLQIISILGIAFWKKWGVFGFVFLNLISPITALLNTQSALPVFASLIQSATLVLILYLLVKPKWQFFA